MANQTILGKAYEYACLNAIFNQLSGIQHIVIENNRAVETAKDFYETTSEAIVSKMDLAAEAAARVIMRLEPQLQHPNNNEPLILSIQEDARGIAGDVRDVLCIRRQNEWEIGLSCKHNHSAVKHSRLSNTINFGQQWFGKPCSQMYFEEISPIFLELCELQAQGVLWKNVEHKDDRFYVPLLNAFISELRRLDRDNPNEIPKNLLMYLLGRNDYYKVISKDSEKLTQIQAYNIYGTLNRNSENIRPQTRVHQLTLPERFFEINYKPRSKTTINISCNNGWAVSLRIHSASTKVEPSLKFDINLIGVPPSLYTHYESWKDY